MQVPHLITLLPSLLLVRGSHTHTYTLPGEARMSPCELRGSSRPHPPGMSWKRQLQASCGVWSGRGELLGDPAGSRAGGLLSCLLASGPLPSPGASWHSWAGWRSPAWRWPEPLPVSFPLPLPFIQQQCLGPRPPSAPSPRSLPVSLSLSL